MGLYNYKVQRKLTKKGQAKQEEKAIRQHQTSSADDILASGAIEYSPVDPIMMATGVGAAVRGGQALLPAVADELTMGGRGLFNLGKAGVKNIGKLKGVFKKDIQDMVSEYATEISRRSRTKEGAKRAAYMGKEQELWDEDVMKGVGFASQKHGTAQYSKMFNEIGYNKTIPKQYIKQILRHETEHYLQKGNLSKIDDLLDNLDLKPDTENLRTAKSFWGKITSGTTDDVSNLKQMFIDDKAALNYFKTQKGEKSAFLAEAQQYMFDNKIIKNAYDDITPDIVKKAYNKSKKGGALRIFNITEPSEKNFKLMSEGLNKMFQAGAPIGLAGGLYNTNTK